MPLPRGGMTKEPTLERRFALLRHDHSQHLTTADGTVVEGSVARCWKGNWTPVLRGDGSAGTYELAGSYGRWTRVGDLVTLSAEIVLASSITGGGSGNLVVSTLPFAPYSTRGKWWGSLFIDGVDIPGVFCAAEITYSNSSYIYLIAMTDNSSYAALQPTAVAANDLMQLSITYEAMPIT